MRAQYDDCSYIPGSELWRKKLVYKLRDAHYTREQYHDGGCWCLYTSHISYSCRFGTNQDQVPGTASSRSCVPEYSLIFPGRNQPRVQYSLDNAFRIFFFLLARKRSRFVILICLTRYALGAVNLAEISAATRKHHQRFYTECVSSTTCMYDDDYACCCYCVRALFHCVRSVTPQSLDQQLRCYQRSYYWGYVFFSSSTTYMTTMQSCFLSRLAGLFEHQVLSISNASTWSIYNAICMLERTSWHSRNMLLMFRLGMYVFC